MKRTIYIMAVMSMLAIGGANGQLYRGAYFIEGAPQRGAFNPAFRPTRGYIYLPGAGNLNLNYTSNALTLDNIIYPYEGKNVLIFHESVKWNMIEQFLKPSNDLDVEVSLPVVSFGFFAGRGFWTFDTRIKTDAGFSLPKDLFHFMKGVESGEQHFSMGNMAVGMNVCLTASLGYSYRVFSNLTVGARVNFLGGLAHAKVKYDKLGVNLTTDVWDINAAGNITMAGEGVTIDEVLDEQVGRKILDFGSLDFDLKKIRGFVGQGVTFDVGAEYELLDRIKFSLSVLDLGFMSWNKKNITYAASESHYTWNNDRTSGDFADFTRFYRESDPERIPGVRRKFRATFIAGAQFDIFGNDLLSAGLMYMNRKREFSKRSELSVSLTVRPLTWFSASVSYAMRGYGSVGDSFVNTLGFALDFHPCWINFFVGSDYLFSRVNSWFIPMSQKAINLYFGISVPLSRERPRKLPKLGI